jgi:hypothetical protein
MNLTLVLHARCNASCTHCSRSYGPHRTEALDRADLLRLMDEAAAIDDGQPLQFDLTGGEPFLRFELLTEIVAHGARLGGGVSCVTNAYWARSPQLARERLDILRAAGLTGLGVSVSRFHQQFVPLQRVRWTLEAAASLGLRTELKGAITQQDLVPDGTLDGWKSALDADHINIFPVLAQLRQGATLPDEDYYREPGLPEEQCPGAGVCIEFDGVATSCVAPSMDDGFLIIGNAHSMTLAEIHKSFRTQGRQRILREAGPVAFARGAVRAGVGHYLRDSYAGPCDLCMHIRTQPQLRRVAEEMSAVADASLDHDT